MPSIPTAASLNIPESKADVGSLREGATEFEAKSGAIIGRGGEVVAQMKTTAVEFTELVSEQLKARGTESIEAARTAMQGSVWGSAVTGKWADAAETYQQIAANYAVLWADAVSSGFGVTAESAGVTGGMPSDVASKVMDNAIADAGAERLATMQGIVNGAYEKYKDEAKLAGTRLQQGPTPANLKALSGGGTTTWTLFNAFGLKAGAPPLTGADGKRLAEAMLAYLAGDEDAIPPALRTQIKNLLALAQHAQGIQGTGKLLDHGQLDFLQQLFKGMDVPWNDQDPNGATVFAMLPHWLKERDVSGTDQAFVLGAFGGGLLAMTNEKIGGGFGRLPESLRKTLGYYTGKVDDFDVPTLHDQLISLAPYLGATTAKHVGLGKLQGGKEFSASLTLAVADFYSEVTARRPAYSVPYTDLEEFAPALLEASTRNTDANYELLTGKFQHPDIGKHTPEYLVRSLFGNTWDKDAGAGAAGLIDWIGTDAGSKDPATVDRATEAAYALFTTMTDRDNASGLFKQSAYDFFTDSYGKIGSFEKAPIGVANGAITYAMAKTAVPYLDYFAETDTGGKDQLFMSKDPRAADMYLSQQTREDFVELIMGGDASRDKFGEEVYRNVLLDAHYADNWKDTEEANDEAMRTGRLMGLLDTGFQRVFDDADMDANAKTTESTQHANWARAGAAAVKEVVTELPFVRGVGRGAQQIIRQVTESFKWTPGVAHSSDLIWEKGVAPKPEDFDRKGDPSYEEFNFAVTHTVIEQQLKDTDSGITIEDVRKADDRLVEQVKGKWQLRPADELMKIQEPSGESEDKGMYTYSDAERELHRLLEQKLKDKVDKFNNTFNLQRKDTGG